MSNPHTAHNDGIDFGHEFHGHEHHFRVTREALEFLAQQRDLDELGMVPRTTRTSRASTRWRRSYRGLPMVRRAS